MQIKGYFKITSAWNFSSPNNDLIDQPWFADLTAEECDRYLRWWHKFRILSRISWLGIGLVLVPYLGGRYYRSHLWDVLGICGLLLVLVTRVWLRILNCPRCGVTYSGGWITILGRFVFLDHCYGCDLTAEKLAELKKYSDSASV